MKGEYKLYKRERAVYKDMVDRCHKSSDKTYPYYGERGIIVCQRWRDSFWSFVEDIGKIPRGMSIERIDNNGPYSPENCCVIPRSKQALNRRSTKWITIDGVTKCLKDWLNVYGLTSHAYYERLKKGYSAEEALKLIKQSTPTYITIDGETKYIKEWLVVYGLSYTHYKRRRRNGMTPVEALTKPIKRYKQTTF